MSSEFCRGAHLCTLFRVPGAYKLVTAAAHKHVAGSIPGERTYTSAVPPTQFLGRAGRRERRIVDMSARKEGSICRRILQLTDAAVRFAPCETS